MKDQITFPIDAVPLDCKHEQMVDYGNGSGCCATCGEPVNRGECRHNEREYHDGKSHCAKCGANTTYLKDWLEYIEDEFTGGCVTSMDELYFRSLEDFTLHKEKAKTNECVDCSAREPQLREVPKMAKETTQESLVQLDNTGEIELPKLDVTKYIGTKAKIASVTEHKGNYGFYIRVATDVIDTVGDGDNKIELKPSRIFGLQSDSTGRIGWGADTKLGAFLKKMQVAHYRDLVGKEVIVQTQTNNDTDFLTF